MIYELFEHFQYLAQTVLPICYKPPYIGFFRFCLEIIDIEVCVQFCGLFIDMTYHWFTPLRAAFVMYVWWQLYMVISERPISSMPVSYAWTTWILPFIG